MGTVCDRGRKSVLNMSNKKVPTETGKDLGAKEKSERKT